MDIGKRIIAIAKSTGFLSLCLGLIALIFYRGDVHDFMDELSGFATINQAHADYTGGSGGQPEGGMSPGQDPGDSASCDM